MALSKTDKYNSRLGQLKSDRSSFIDYWRELSDFHLASRGRFLVTDYNKGNKRNTKQLNNTSRKAVRTLASGMMAGITSPARPWFRLSTPYPELNDVSVVREWLHDVQTLMREVFSQSNLYNALHSAYGELGTFGSASIGIFEDFDNVVRFQNYTVGSYMWASNGRNEVDTQYREYQYTVAQTVNEFGLDNCSNQVQQYWKNGNLSAPVKICHVVEPNDNRDNNNPLAKYKRVKSLYYEMGDGAKGFNSMHFLRESGFDEFPILTPRWDITGEDVYGTDCPGMMALGDTKELQLLERRLAQAIDKVANPPTQAPVSLRNTLNRGGIAAGEITWVNSTADGGIRSIYDYRPDLSALQAKIDIVEQRIEESFYSDLFLMLSNSDRRQITAREIAERHEEKLLMLGPVLERLHTEMLDPLIDRVFNIMQKAGILPPPPEELQQVELRVEYISVLAQAQRMVAVGGIERLLEFTTAAAQLDPGAIHKINLDEAIDEYGDSLGVNPRIIRGEREVAELRAQEAQQRQLAQQMEMASQTAQMAKDASAVDTDGANPVADLIRQQTGA